MTTDDRLLKRAVTTASTFECRCSDPSSFPFPPKEMKEMKNEPFILDVFV